MFYYIDEMELLHESSKEVVSDKLTPITKEEYDALIAAQEESE